MEEIRGMKENLHVRKIIRLQNYNYAKESMYFIRIRVKDKLEKR